MTYRVRITKPIPTEWRNVEADSPEDAAQELHSQLTSFSGASVGIRYVPHADKPGAAIHFAIVEVDGHGEMLSRIYTSGIVRRGGIRRNRVTLADVAKAIGWTGDPQDLVAPGWSHEQEEWT